MGPGALGPVPAGLTDASIDGVFTDYADSVSGAGGVPVLLARSTSIPDLVSRLDGLVLSGGEDVEPLHYGSTPGPFATKYDAGRDEFEMALIRNAIRVHLPILAICRGAQILNVTLGGTLVPHLSARDGFSHYDTDFHRSEKRQTIILTNDSSLSRIYSAEAEEGEIRVNSYHHQAILQPGAGLSVAARAFDGIIEAVEMGGCDVIGVQWHPEMHAGVDALFTWLIHVSRPQTGSTS